MQPIPAMDGHLFFAILCSLGRYPETLYDLKKIKVLNAFYSSSVPRNQTAEDPAVKGDFSAIGEMENLHTLHFPNGANYPTLQINDFSFLTKCKKLKGLDLSCTNFTDCSLLLQLPALKYARLPEKEKLTNPELLKKLPETVKVSFLHQAPAVSSVSTYTPPPQKTPEGSGRAKAIVAEIKKRTAMECYKLTIQPGVTPGLTDSKFGGFPYWVPSMPYPVDPAGKKLVLLAQLNFDQLPAGEPLPDHGLLQFFIGQDDVCGADFDAPNQQTGFRVVYHETIDPSVTEEQLKPLDIPTHEGLEYFPVFQAAAVAAEKDISYINEDAPRFKALFAQVVKDVTGEETAVSAYKYFDKDDYSYFHDQLYSSGHRMLGYPFFTQYDPRPEGSPYDTLLFQMDSDGSREADYVLWGDCGVANFFINLEDLKRRDFSKVFYTWDCC